MRGRRGGAAARALAELLSNLRGGEPRRQRPHISPRAPPHAVDHSIVMYLVGPDGDFLDFFVQSMTPPEIVARIQERMRTQQR